MRKPLRTICRGVGLAFLSCVGIAVAAEPVTLLRIDGSRGDFIGQGVDQTFDEDDGSIVVLSAASGALDVTFESGTQGFGLAFAAPEGEALAPGNYEDAVNDGDESPLSPRIGAASSGRSCGTSKGRFVVRELARDVATGEVTSLALDFEHYCDRQAVPLTGAVRYRSSVPLDPPEPTASARADQVALEREIVVLDGSHTMQGVSAISTWRWHQLAGTPVEIDDDGESIATFTAPAVPPPGDLLRFELRVENADGLVDRDDVDVFIQHKRSERSVAFLSSDGFRLDEPSRVLLPQSGLFESVGSALAPSLAFLRWRGVGNDVNFSFMDATPLAVGVYASNSDTGLYPAFGISANSNACDRVNGEFRILDIGFSGDTLSRLAVDFEQYCNDLPTPLRGKVRFNVLIPDANAGPDLDAEGGSHVTLTAAASEPAVGGLATFSWHQVSGPAVTLDGATTATAGFTAPDVDEATTLAFELTVVDDRGIDDSDVMQVEVMPAPPPPPPPPPPPRGGGGGGATGGLVLALLAMLAWIRARNGGRCRA